MEEAPLIVIIVTAIVMVMMVVVEARQSGELRPGIVYLCVWKPDGEKLLHGPAWALRGKERADRRLLHKAQQPRSCANIRRTFLFSPRRRAPTAFFFSPLLAAPLFGPMKSIEARK